MPTTNFLRRLVLSITPFVCASLLAPVPSFAQNVSSNSNSTSLLQYAVYHGIARDGWYSYPGQQPRLRFKGDTLNITSRKHSTVLLSRLAGADSAAEVSLVRPPISTSSISGLAVMSDAQHALVIGLEGGNVVLWQLDPNGARMLDSHPVNSSSPLEFRVSGNTASDVRFFWRHKREGSTWHSLGDRQSVALLSRWTGSIHFGLLLDGPRGSQVTFSHYRDISSTMAENRSETMIALIR